MSGWGFLVAVLGATIAAALLLASRRRSAGTVYQPAGALFSAAERSFLGVLEQAVGPEFRVFGKVRVADIVGVKSGLAPRVRQSAFNRISGKHFDFVVCRADDLSVACVVELNDSSHSNKRVQKRDGFLADVCRQAAVPLVAITAKRSYSLLDVRQQVSSAIAVPDDHFRERMGEQGEVKR